MPRNRSSKTLFRKRGLAVCLAAVLLLCACGCEPQKKKDPADASAQTHSASDALAEQATPTEATAAATTAPATTVPASSEPATQKKTTLQTNGSTVQLSALSHLTTDENAPVVYFTKNIDSKAMLFLYIVMMNALPGNVAVKLTTGESQATNYLKPELIGDLVRAVNGTIIECMTAYGGVRSTVLLSKQAAADRGYTKIATFDLLDENGDITIPYEGTRINRAIVGSHLRNYNSVLVLSHFKGHPMAGFGGAIKNVGIGMSSRRGKVYVHSAGTRTVGVILHSDQDAWLEALAETVKAVSDYMNNGQNMLYISVMNRLSVDCDCMALPTAPDMHDIGILASADPVALDQACVDLVYAVPDGKSLINRMESLNGVHVLEHAEKIGLGSRSYRLVCIDE